MNVKLLRKVAKHILAEPKRFYMNGVEQRGAPGQIVWLDGIERVIPQCGTVACIAGWACILSGSRNVSMGSAERLLGISGEESSNLFLDTYWPSAFYVRWRAAKTLKTRAKIAAQRIEHFIKTGE